MRSQKNFSFIDSKLTFREQFEKNGRFVDCRPLEVPFLVPPKLPILGIFGNLGGTENGTSSGLQSTKLVGTIRVTKKMSHMVVAQRLVSGADVGLELPG